MVTSEGGQAFLTELGDLSGPYPREIPLGDLDPLGVALGEGFVWVLGKSVRGNFVLKVDPRRRAVVDRLAVSPGEQVTDIAAGAGSVWFTDFLTEETLSRLDPDTMRITGHVDTAGDDSVAIGEGAVWLADIETGTVTRVDPETMTVEKRVKAFTPPFLAAVDLAVGGGAVWLSNTDTGRVYRIDPETLRIDTRIDLAPKATETVPFPPGPRGIAADDDAVWVAIGEK
jgi:streptogramin lyase